MSWLGYSWTIAVNCFYLFIILAVFDKLDHRPEAVVVAILGLIYVAVRTTGMGLGWAHGHTLFHLNKQLLRIRSRLNDPPTEVEIEDMKKYEKIEREGMPKLIINGLFLSITSLACLWFLWIELWGH